MCEAFVFSSESVTFKSFEIIFTPNWYRPTFLCKSSPDSASKTWSSTHKNVLISRIRDNYHCLDEFLVVFPLPELKTFIHVDVMTRVLVEKVDVINTRERSRKRFLVQVGG